MKRSGRGRVRGPLERACPSLWRCDHGLVVVGGEPLKTFKKAWLWAFLRGIASIRTGGRTATRTSLRIASTGSGRSRVGKLVPVPRYDKGCSGENVEFVGIAA